MHAFALKPKFSENTGPKKKCFAAFVRIAKNAFKNCQIRMLFLPSVGKTSCRMIHKKNWKNVFRRKSFKMFQNNLNIQYKFPNNFNKLLFLKIFERKWLSRTWRIATSILRKYQPERRMLCTDFATKTSKIKKKFFIFSKALKNHQKNNLTLTSTIFNKFWENKIAIFLFFGRKKI